MTWLIDSTDQRFKIPVNADVIGYIRRANPFAHSDLGRKLIDLNGALSGASVYSPDFKVCAYVLLHNTANAIFAFAADMRDLLFRLLSALHDEVLAPGHGRPSRIGGEWVDIPAFAPDGQRAAADARLSHYCIAAQRHAAALSSGA